MRPPTYLLPVIVLAQFCCTSLWFASNGVLSQLSEAFQLPVSALEHLTSGVQLGFIVGTLLFAFFTIADRFSPSKVFFACAIAGALTNLSMLWSENTYTTLVVSRFLTGFFLAGIYPVGMKVAADYYDKGLGKSLGYLVGALVLGTAFPHFVSIFSLAIPWQGLLTVTSVVAAAGGSLMLILVPDGPFRKKALQLDFKAIGKVFKQPDFRRAALGYFGHMWELYAFWAFLPLFLEGYKSYEPAAFNSAFWSFLIIAIGSLGCVLGGLASQYVGSKKVAVVALTLSGMCCIVSPWCFELGEPIFLGFLVCWGLFVIADSPMFSTLVAKSTAPSNKGTALTIVNSIGFAITIVSIQVLGVLATYLPIKYLFLVLALGPLLGLLYFRKGTFY